MWLFVNVLLLWRQIMTELESMQEQVQRQAKRINKLARVLKEVSECQSCSYCARRASSALDKEE